MDKHFHIYMGGNNGFMHGEAAFESAQESVDAFLNLTREILQDQIAPNPVMTEAALMNCAETDVNEAVYIDAGKLRFVWVVCDGVCQTYIRN